MSQAPTVPTRSDSSTGTIDPTRLQWANWGGPLEHEGHTFVIGQHIPGMGEHYTNLFARLVRRLVPVMVSPEGPADLAPGARWKVGAVHPAEYVAMKEFEGLKVGEVAVGVRQHPSFHMLLRQRVLRPATPAEFFAAVAVGKAKAPPKESEEPILDWETVRTWGTCMPGAWWTQEPYCGPGALQEEVQAVPPEMNAPGHERAADPSTVDVLERLGAILAKVAGLENARREQGDAVAQLADAVTVLAGRVSTMERAQPPVVAPAERRTRSRSAE